MRISVVGARYAKALAEAVLAPNSGLDPTTAVAQLQMFEDMVSSSPDLHAVLLTPAIPPSRKRAVVGRLASEAGISPLIRNFLFVVVDHKRTADLAGMREAFTALIDEHLGFVRADVTSAAPLDETQRKSVEAQLMRISGKKIKMENSVDPDLLGGIVARVGSTVYDGSIRGQLEVLRRKLTSESADYKVGI